MPGANWRSEMAKKTMPLMINFFSGWLDYPEYFFFWAYSGQNAIFNTPSYVNADMDVLIDGARAAAAIGDKEKYAKDVGGFISKAYAEVPRIPLFQPYLNVATQKNISGYVYWFHRQLDYRSIVKGEVQRRCHGVARDPERGEHNGDSQAARNGYPDPDRA